MQWPSVQSCVETYRSRGGEAKPTSVGVIIGSGLAGLIEELPLKRTTTYAQLGLPDPSVSGHRAILQEFALNAATNCLVAQGRFHMYEGHSAFETTIMIRIMHGLGVRTFILTNAAGCLLPDWNLPGFMVIRDHLNLTGFSPGLRKQDRPIEFAKDPSLFLDMNEAYHKQMRQNFLNHCSREGYDIKEGIYAGVLGPCYETPAEVNMLRVLGAHAVGMSTVQEVIMARYLGCDVLGLSCLTNYGAGLDVGMQKHEDVLEQGRHAAHAIAGSFKEFLQDLVRSQN